MIGGNRKSRKIYILTQMYMKSHIIKNYIFLFAGLIVLGFFYKRMEDKRIREENKDNYDTINRFLLDEDTLAKSKKPILWIHVPYEYNSRNWLSFGSRSSFELNQPYLYLTVKSIIHHCDDDFTICLIDDTTFKRIIPGWSIDMTRISSPILDNMRQLALMKLLNIYGGMICPISFLCIKSLQGLYAKGTRDGRMFVCETTNRTITSTTFDHYSNVTFCGAPKRNQSVEQLIDFMQRTIAMDSTAESKFLGNFDRWANKRGEITKIDGREIGTKTMDDRQVTVDDLMSNHYIDFYKQMYGILIPADELKSRHKFEWFTRMSAKQVLESNTILGNYFLVNMGEASNILEANRTMRPKNWVGFWRTPLNPEGIYGQKPNFLGDNLQVTHP
jgi:hypothetical protein